MKHEYEVTICLGSSCFSRGNKKTVHAIKEFLDKHGLEEKVYFHGAHCTNNCDKGPVLEINDQVFYQVNEQRALSILEEAFGHIIH